MARTDLTINQAPGAYPTAGVALTWDNCDSANGNQFTFTANELVLVRNGHGSAAKTVTLTSAADGQGRVKHISAQSIAAGVTKVFGPFKSKSGWQQSGGKFFLTGEDNNIKFAVVRL